MKITAITASMFLAGALLASASAANAGSTCYSGPVGREHPAQGTCGPVRTQVIHIDCYRGPWRATIWDHPQGSFVDDLVKYGYDYGDANAIATEICKNVDLVGNEGALRSALMKALADDPPGPR